MSDTVQITVDRKKLDAFLAKYYPRVYDSGASELSDDILAHGYRPAREIVVTVTYTGEEAQYVIDAWGATTGSMLNCRTLAKLAAACRAALAKEPR